MAQTNVQAFSGDVAISSNLAVDTNTLFVDSVGNKVGIGVTNPATYLHLSAKNSDPGATEGDFAGTHTLTEYLRFTSLGDSADVNNVSVGFKLGADDNSTLAPDGRLDICANQGTANNEGGGVPNKTIATFLGSGNVGIGKTNPGSALDVVGDVAISGDTILGTATYRKRRDWNRNALAYVYLGNIRTYQTTGIRLDVSINNANSGYQMFNFQINLNGSDAAHSGGQLVYSVQGTANDSVLRAVEIGYVFLDDGTGLYTYQLWLKDPTTDVSGPMNAYLNCQGYYIFDTGVSDVAQGGAAPTNFNVGVVGILVDTIGNVGIGTTNPGATLHVYNNSLGSTTGNSTDILHFGGDSGGAGALLLTAERLSTGSDWSSTGLRLQKIVDVTKMAYVQFGSNTGNVSGELLFGNGDATERMRIASNGNVGIGTTNPPGMLSIYTGDTAKCGFSIDRYATGEYRTEFYQGANGLDIKVGHGTVAPTTVVDIERFSAISSRLRINSPGCLRTDGGVEVASYNDITSVKMIWDTGSRYRIYADTDNRMIFSTAGGNGTLAATTCLGLNGTNLGVGLPTPSHKLHVAGNVLASGFFNHRQQFTVATGVTTTVVTMPNGCQGHVYLIGNNYIFAAARFAYKAGWMGIYFVSIYSSNLTTWTNNGQNIWARHDRGSNQTVVCRTLHVGDY